MHVSPRQQATGRRAGAAAGGDVGGGDAMSDCDLIACERARAGEAARGAVMLLYVTEKLFGKKIPALSLSRESSLGLINDSTRPTKRPERAPNCPKESLKICPFF